MNWVFLDSGLTAKVGKSVPEREREEHLQEARTVVTQEMNGVLGRGETCSREEL